MNKIQRVIAFAGAATAMILALSGLPKVAQAIEHTTGHQVGKVAVFAEFCAYGSRARQIRSKYSNLPNFDDGYKYWRKYLGKYDIVHPPCGQVKDIADQLISSNVQDLGAQQSESVEKATPEGREDFDGRWVIEIADASDESRTDTRIIEIKDGRFSVEVSFYGWRGAVAGQIDGSGNLTGKANLKKMGYGRRIDPFEASYREGEFHAKTVSKSRSGGVYKGAAAFMIDLTRATASSEVECISTECEAKDEQATGSSWPCLKWVRVGRKSTPSITSAVER